MDWLIEPLKLELKYTWKISRNSSDFKQNFVVVCTDGKLDGLGEIAPNIRYGETSEKILSSFEKVKVFLKIASHLSHSEFEHKLALLQIPNSLKFGIESAYVMYLSRKANKSIAEFLNIPVKKSISTCYTLPIMPLNELKEFYEEYDLGRFSFLKVKVNAANALENISRISEFTNQTLMIDGNEAWVNPDEVVSFTKAIEKFNIEFIEQPIPSNEIEAYKYLKSKSALPVMADESAIDYPNFDELALQFHGINMKLMKAGSYINGLRIIEESKKRNLKTMVGCMVESTLGISSAFYLAALTDYADLDGCLIVANENFKLLKETNGGFELN
jgi:L-alanine-DL-glutamate epimerase-like enolase superfamily enzyme